MIHILWHLAVVASSAQHTKTVASCTLWFQANTIMAKDRDGTSN
jgi:hypothetical protein